MAKQFLTGLNLNKNELQNARIQNLSSDPASPVAGQIYYNTTNNVLKYYDGTAWLTLAQGGDVSGAIANAIAAIDTDEIEEGSNNLYYTTSRGQEDAASLLTGATKTNITITGNAISGLTITAENGVADSDTDDLTEGANNLYFTNTRARDAVSAGDTSLVYNSVSGAFTANTSVLATIAYVDGEISGLVSEVSNSLSDVNNTIDALTTTDIAEGTNEYFTEARARTSISAGDNSLTYNSVSGVLTANTSTLATVAYVDAAVQGLDIKESVRVATTSNINLTSGSPVSEIDGVALSFPSVTRVLVKNQTNPAENGIYEHKQASTGDGGNTWTRTDDALEITPGTFVFVEEGTVNGDAGFVVSTNGAITVGTTNITWTQFSGAGQVTAGAGLTKTGNTLDAVGTADRITVNADSIDISSTYAGQTSIVTLGTVATGTWQGNAVAVAYGGTGATTAAGARSNLGATTKYAVSNTLLEPTSNVVTWVITHALNTEDVTVQMRELSSDALVEADVVITNANTVTISWTSAANVNADVYRAVVVG
jgi:hypothetical protein